VVKTRAYTILFTSVSLHPKCGTSQHLLAQRCLIACSHCRHKQDKTVLSSLVLIGGVNTTTDKTRQFCLVSTQFPRSRDQDQGHTRITEYIFAGGPPSTERQCSSRYFLGFGWVWSQILIKNTLRHHRITLIATTADILISVCNRLNNDMHRELFVA